MSHSKYLDSLSMEEKEKLREKLWLQQNKCCFICGKEIDLNLNIINIDHIVPLANNGKDIESNFALTHENCNKSKQDADLNVARSLAVLNKIKETVPKGGVTSLEQVLAYFKGSKYDFKYRINDNIIEYSFSEYGDDTIYQAPIYTDSLSGEKTTFLEIPIEYIFHDQSINPRGINSSISLLVKEFYKKNPQLHMSLARIDDGKIKVFDGQHKAVAQLLLGVRKLVLRIFLDADVDRLRETNLNAGGKLKQIAFDKAIIRQLHDTEYQEKLEKYQQDHGLSEDDYSFSEQQVVDHFKGERGNIRTYIINSLKNRVTHNSKLTNYIDFEGRGKDLPLSYSTFEKTFLSLFVNPKTILTTPIDYREDEGLNPRMLEQQQLIQLCDIIAEEIYIGKFQDNIGINRIEQRIINRQDQDITDDHLVAYRVSKEEIFINWLKNIKQIIKGYFINIGLDYDEENLFQQKFSDQLWENIRTFIQNFIALPVWKDRALSSTIFSGKQTYDYWKKVFTTGSTPDGTPVLAHEINYMELIKR